MKSFLGWLMLMAALAVPAFLFYNWWTRMQSQPNQLEASQDVSQAPTFGGVRSVKGGLENPIQPAVASGATEQALSSSGAVASASAAEPASAPEDAQAQAAAPAAGSGTAPSATPSVGMGNAQAPTATGSTDSASGPTSAMPPVGEARKKGKEIEYAPQTDRDPTLSVLDVKLLKLEEEARRRALEPPKCQRGERLKNGECVKVEMRAAPKAPPIDQEIKVQGIIGSADGGRAAIINDEVRYVGESVKGAEIKKITGTTVIFKFQGKTFYKKME